MTLLTIAVEIMEASYVKGRIVIVSHSKCPRARLQLHSGKRQNNFWKGTRPLLVITTDLPLPTLVEALWPGSGKARARLGPDDGLTNLSMLR